MARETKTEAIRRSLLERLLREQIWPRIPEDVRGKRLTKQEREEILGYGREGF